MNDGQKNQVIQLRLGGMSYTEIARTLSIPVNTVKSVCHRNNAIPQITANNEKRNKERQLNCKNCNAPLNLNTKTKHRVFCSDKCRMMWWNAHPEKLNGKHAFVTCKGCGKVFNGSGRERKYCTHECYIASRFKKAGIAI